MDLTQQLGGQKLEAVDTLPAKVRRDVLKTQLTARHFPVTNQQWTTLRTKLVELLASEGNQAVAGGSAAAVAPLPDRGDVLMADPAEPMADPAEPMDEGPV